MLYKVLCLKNHILINNKQCRLHVVQGTVSEESINNVTYMLYKVLCLSNHILVNNVGHLCQLLNLEFHESAQFPVEMHHIKNLEFYYIHQETLRVLNF